MKDFFDILKHEVKYVGFAVSLYFIWRCCTYLPLSPYNFLRELIFATIFQTCLLIIQKTWKSFFFEDDEDDIYLKKKK